MNLAYILSGGAPVKKRYKLGATSTTAAGVPLMAATTANAGLILLPSTAITAVTDCVGVSLDTGTYVTAQTVASAEGMITMIINPDAVWRLHAVGSAAAGVALALTTNDVAETAGLVIDKTGATAVGDPDCNSPTMLEGFAVCLSGANKGSSRKITTVGATSATVTVAFPNGVGSGDEFILLPWEIAGVNSNLVWLTTNLDEARANVAANSVGATMGVVDLEVDFGDTTTGRNRTFIHCLISDQWLKDLTF